MLRSDARPGQSLSRSERLAWHGSAIERSRAGRDNPWRTPFRSSPMTTRRAFLRAAFAAGALAVPSLGRARTAPRSSSALRVLILGGTGFLGPHLVHELVRRAHAVSILTRGRREPALYEADFAGVEQLTGDRSQPDGLAALRGRTWDIVIETSGYQHTWTRDSAGAVRGRAERYLYVSSTGVYWPYRTVEIAEDGPVPLRDEPPQPQPSYGVMKALSENEVRNAFGTGAIVVRPGYIVGPGDTSDRWTYWPVRIARGGEILVAGRKDDRVQYIDVRDLAAWLVGLLAAGATGTFNAVGPARPQTLEEFVYGVAANTAAPLSWTWIEDYAWLKQYPLRKNPDGTSEGMIYSIPWVMAEGDDLGHQRIDGRKALAAGLTLRPLADTARDTLQWRASDTVPPALRERPRYVLTAEQERAILDAWKRRGWGRAARRFSRAAPARPRSRRAPSASPPARPSSAPAPRGARTRAHRRPP
ncbi:MAG: NAD-dependent epimerase/dehydratase family protein [Gemmatimonadetes bacterium]|nr:NAD-dependent epimerase/dehydratase family protein [Gemmatimonadota bacterium]